jgi:hypothetical protein
MPTHPGKIIENNRVLFNGEIMGTILLMGSTEGHSCPNQVIK